MPPPKWEVPAECRMNTLNGLHDWHLTHSSQSGTLRVFTCLHCGLQYDEDSSG